MAGQFIILFAIILTGFILRKLKVLDEQMNHGLNRFIVYFAYPCMIVHNMGTLEFDGKLLRDFAITLLLSLAMFAVYSVFAYYYGKLRKFPRENSNVAEFSMVSPNNGFMGFPITSVFFGQRALLFMIAHNTAMNLFFFTYGIALMRRNDKKRAKATFMGLMVSLAKLLVNPNILALVAGLLISLSPIGFEGSIVDEYMLDIGQVATPMAMIFIGSTLAQCDLTAIKNKMVIEGTVNKLVILPLITYALVTFLPLDPLVKAMVVLGCCFPGAATVSMLAEQEGQDKDLASVMLFLSTVASIATLPVAVNIIDKIML